VGKALRYGLQGTRRERAAGMARQRQETGCLGRLTHGPTARARAQSAGEGRRAYKEPPGGEQPCAFVNAPVRVQSLCLKQPERMEALGRVGWWALLLWRRGARARRGQVATTGRTLTGWDKQETQQPTACMLMSTCAAVIVVKGGAARQLAQPLSAGPQAYRSA
jgi:hypothetical protein